MGHYVYDFDRPFSSPDISNVAPRGFLYRQLNEISGRNENNIKSARLSRYFEPVRFTILDILIFLYFALYWKRINDLKEVLLVSLLCQLSTLSCYFYIVFDIGNE